MLKLQTLSNQYILDVGQPQKKPRNIKEFDDCVNCIAQSRKKGLSVLFDQIEHEITTKSEFILSQQEQMRNM